MFDKGETLASQKAIAREANRLRDWISSAADDRPLFLFWTSYSHPAIGGTQKRTTTLARKLSHHSNVGFITFATTLAPDLASPHSRSVPTASAQPHPQLCVALCRQI